MHVLVDGRSDSSPVVICGLGTGIKENRVPERCGSFWMLGPCSSFGSCFAIGPASFLLSLEVAIIIVLAIGSSTNSSTGSCLMLCMCLISIASTPPKIRRRERKSSSAFQIHSWS